MAKGERKLIVYPCGLLKCLYNASM